ncbi:hypothetical protein PR048_023870 [Dryococelus australis]|uniref:Uncharacterized protein n=1 Tax=Dryococelus australis TaxID=614101 RepID=A0ABQ9GVC9_9NEOP|nr:hypothetical protein PR048_023870 [Dryococelus australis]
MAGDCGTTASEVSWLEWTRGQWSEPEWRECSTLVGLPFLPLVSILDQAFGQFLLVGHRLVGPSPAFTWSCQLPALTNALLPLPPTKVNRVRFPAGQRPEISHSAGSLGDLPFPPSLHAGAALHAPHFAIIGSQYFDVLFAKTRAAADRLAARCLLDCAAPAIVHRPATLERSRRASGIHSGVIGEVLAARNTEVLRAVEGEMTRGWSTVGIQGWGKQEIQEKTRIIRHDSHVRKTWYRTRFVLLGGERSTRWSTAAPLGSNVVYCILFSEEFFVNFVRRCTYPLSVSKTTLMPGCTNIFPDPRSNDPSSEPESSLILVPIKQPNVVLFAGVFSNYICRRWLLIPDRDFEPLISAVRNELPLDIQSSSELEWCNSFLCLSYTRSRIEFRTTVVQPGIKRLTGLKQLSLNSPRGRGWKGPGTKARYKTFTRKNLMGREVRGRAIKAAGSDYNEQGAATGSCFYLAFRRLHPLSRGPRGRSRDTARRLPTTFCNSDCVPPLCLLLLIGSARLSRCFQRPD